MFISQTGKGRDPMKLNFEDLEMGNEIYKGQISKSILEKWDQKLSKNHVYSPSYSH